MEKVGIKMNQNEIWMIQGTDYKENTKHLLEAADLETKIKKKNGENKNCKIGIKPNLVAPSEASYGGTTHPEVVEGIIEYLQERGYQNLVILEGSWVGDKTEESFEVCGYQKLSEKYQVPLADMQKDSSSLCECKGMELLICDTALKLDFLINVPVLKGHCQTKLTCALKNLKGLIPNKEKRHFHTMGLHEPIAHLNAYLQQDFIVVDNICGDLDFEDGGNPVVMNRILAVTDPVLCDAYVCRFLNYEIKEVPYILMAEKLGVGSADIEHAVIKSCGTQTPTDAAILEVRKRKIVELLDAVEEVESCSACYGYLMPALDRLKEEGLLKKLDTKIAIGQGFRGKSGTLGIGNCTAKFACHLKGCPPTETEIYEFLKTYLTDI